MRLVISKRMGKSLHLAIAKSNDSMPIHSIAKIFLEAALLEACDDKGFLRQRAWINVYGAPAVTSVFILDPRYLHPYLRQLGSFNLLKKNKKHFPKAGPEFLLIISGQSKIKDLALCPED